VLQNAEAMKQFEYLEKSLVSFKETVSEQTAELRQVSIRIQSEDSRCPARLQCAHSVLAAGEPKNWRTRQVRPGGPCGKYGK
jgi:hypothetical protein